MAEDVFECNKTSIPIDVSDISLEKMSNIATLSRHARLNIIEECCRWGSKLQREQNFEVNILENIQFSVTSAKSGKHCYDPLLPIALNWWETEDA